MHDLWLVFQKKIVYQYKYLNLDFIESDNGWVYIESQRIVKKWNSGQLIEIIVKIGIKKPNILKKINTNIEVWQHEFKASYVRKQYILYKKKIHFQLVKAEVKQKFNMYMILLSICEHSEKSQIVQQLKQFKYKRNKVMLQKQKKNCNKKQILSNKVINKQQQISSIQYYARKFKFDLLTLIMPSQYLLVRLIKQKSIQNKKNIRKYQNHQLSLQINRNLYGEEYQFIALNYHRLGTLHKSRRNMTNNSNYI